MERRRPAGNNFSNKKEGKGKMIKAPTTLQDLRKKIYIKAKAEKQWRSRKLKGFGWSMWSKGDIYEKLGLYKDYQIRYYSSMKARAADRP